ncbi:MAG: putative glycosyltransferase 36, partial [Actinobacteria bacterium]|nr:putative glycosyltransferase 36 [Actinomycetota bacterium]
MKVSGKSILGNLPHLRESLRGNALAQKFAGDEPPLRSELFSSE